MMRSLAALSFLLLAAPQLLAQDDAAPAHEETYVEPKSKVEFPVKLPVKGSDQPHYLLGAGVRTKTIFGVKVYAVGLYVEPSAARKALQVYRNAQAKNLEKNPKVAESLLQGDFGKTLRLVMTRDVDAEDMREAFEDSLEPRLRKIAAGVENKERGKQALAKFKGQFESELKEGTDLIFTWQPDGKLHSVINGEYKGAIESRELALALFDIYLGADPISKQAKKNFARGVAEMHRRNRSAGAGAAERAADG